MPPPLPLCMQVRVSYLSDGGAVTKRKLAQHHGRAHKLAIVPDYPHCFFRYTQEPTPELTGT